MNEQQQKTPAWAKILGSAIVFAAIYGVYKCATDDEEKETADLPDREETERPQRQQRHPPASQPAKNEDSFSSKLWGTKSLGEALPVLTPLMEDAIGEPSFGATLLSSWMDVHPSWQDLQVVEEVSFKLVAKDSTATRGRRMCAKGSIVQIQRSASMDSRYEGILAIRGFNFVHFISVGSTRDLVEDSRARFCGIVTGLLSYENAMGGVTQAVQAVGMFDLMENRKLGVNEPDPTEQPSTEPRRRKKKPTPGVSQPQVSNSAPKTGFKVN